MKELAFKINGFEQSIKDSQKLIDNMGEFEKWSIKATSAQEILQSILTSPEPLKNLSKIIPAYQKLNNITEHLSKMTDIGIKKQKEAYEIKAKGIKAEIEGAKKIDEENKKKLDAIKKEEQTRWTSRERFNKFIEDSLARIEKEEKNTGKELADDRLKRQKSIEDGEKQLAESFGKINKERKNAIKDTLQTIQKETDDAYAKEIKSIEYKYALEEQQIKNSCDITLAAESEKTGYKVKAASDEEALRNAQYTLLKDLESRKNADLKKAEQEHQKATTAIVENFIKERSTKLEVEVDTTSKKLAKSTKKTAKDVSDFFEGMTQETIDSIIKQSVQTQKASVDAAEAAKKEAAAKTATTTATTAATTATKEATTATKEATAATKKYLDINATRANIKTEVEEFKILQKVLQENYEKQTELYDKEIAEAGDNAEKRKEIEAKKTGYVKQYGVEIIKIQQEINTATEKEQSLGLTKWKQYSQQAEEITNSFKGITSKVSDYFSTAFTAVSGIYKAEIAAIDEEIKQNKVNVEAAKYDAEKSKEAITELQAEQTKATEQGQTEKAQQLQAEIDYHNGIIATKAEYDKKDKELNDKKAKKQKEQEKIDKLNRKATLIKNIGEAIANVSQGVTKALAYGPFIGPVLAAVVAAAGAVQVGVMTKQLAKFEDGGLLRGKRHSQGGMRIEGTNMEVEGGEYVVNRVSTNKNLGLVKYINEQRRELSPSDLNTYFSRSSQIAEPSFKRMFADGGQLPAINNTVNIDNDNLIKAIQSIRIEPKVAVTDIAKVQDSMVSVDGWAGV